MDQDKTHLCIIAKKINYYKYIFYFFNISGIFNITKTKIKNGNERKQKFSNKLLYTVLTTIITAIQVIDCVSFIFYSKLYNKRLKFLFFSFYVMSILFRVYLCKNIYVLHKFAKLTSRRIGVS